MKNCLFNAHSDKTRADIFQSFRNQTFRNNDELVPEVKLGRQSCTLIKKYKQKSFDFLLLHGSTIYLALAI